jgi:hypothetical protein
MTLLEFGHFVYMLWPFQRCRRLRSGRWPRLPATVLVQNCLSDVR